MTDPHEVAAKLSKAQREGLNAFPPGAGQYFRATLMMRWSVFNRLREKGLSEGITYRARLTPPRPRCPRHPSGAIH